MNYGYLVSNYIVLYNMWSIFNTKIKESLNT